MLCLGDASAATCDCIKFHIVELLHSGRGFTCTCRARFDCTLFGYPVLATEIGRLAVGFPFGIAAFAVGAFEAVAGLSLPQGSHTEFPQAMPSAALCPHTCNGSRQRPATVFCNVVTVDPDGSVTAVLLEVLLLLDALEAIPCSTQLSRRVMIRILNVIVVPNAL